MQFGIGLDSLRTFASYFASFAVVLARFTAKAAKVFAKDTKQTGPYLNFRVGDPNRGRLIEEINCVFDDAMNRGENVRLESHEADQES